MKIVTLSILIFFLSSCNQQSISYKEIEHRTKASKDLVKVFSEQLKGQLQTAMKSGGPLVALNICHEQAPLIAKNLSKTSGWSVYRTSLKPRAKKPDAWEKRMMNAFQEQRLKGDKFKHLFVQDIVEVEGKAAFRFMQAIETQKICLACHGENIAPAIASKIKETYPQDIASGFKLGDIRGAFSIVQPLGDK